MGPQAKSPKALRLKAFRGLGFRVLIGIRADGQQPPLQQAFVWSSNGRAPPRERQAPGALGLRGNRGKKDFGCSGLWAMGFGLRLFGFRLSGFKVFCLLLLCGQSVRSRPHLCQYGVQSFSGK